MTPTDNRPTEEKHMNEDKIPMIGPMIHGGSAGTCTVGPGVTAGREMFYRPSDGEMVDGDGNVCSDVDWHTTRMYRVRHAFGEKPNEQTLAFYKTRGFEWGEALKK